MPRSNKGGTDLTRNWKKNKRTYFKRSSATEKGICSGEEPTELLISGDLHRNSNQSVRSELSEEVASKLSKSVILLALSDGHTVLFACSGIAVERLGHVTRVVTSASLVKSLNDQRKDHAYLKVLVRHEDSVVTGFLGEYDLDLNIAAVNVMDLPDLHTKLFDYRVKFLPHSTVVAVGRDIRGKLLNTFGILNGVGSEYSEKLMLSTCKISKDWEGGPLFDVDGNFVGMNLFLDTERIYFLPQKRVVVWLASCKPLDRIKFPAPLNSFKAAVRVGERLTGQIPNSDQEVHRDVLHKDQFRDLESLGYPDPPKSILNHGMILVNTFEEPFGDVYGKGVWSELSETASALVQRNTVALASFSGDSTDRKRFFACTGLFIEWNGCTTVLTSASLLRSSSFENKIIENLRIEVLLPNKQLTEGTLQCYDLHHNVALVSVKDFCADQPAKIEHQRRRGACNIIAVGCCFSSGRLMAARGLEFSRPAGPDCYFLDTLLVKSRRSVGDDGNPSRMLDWAKDGDRKVSPTSSPVPMPYWCHPDDLDKHDHDMPYWFDPDEMDYMHSA